MGRLRPDKRSGIYIGNTRGRAIPRQNGRRGCLCADENRYSVSCCKGALIGQGIGQTEVPGGQERGAFSSGFSNGFDI
jgi:hypothetical protein